MRQLRRPATVVLVALLLSPVVGCTAKAYKSVGSSAHPADTSAPTAAELGVAGCESPSPITFTPMQGPEVQGTGYGATLYGLIMIAGTGPWSVRAGENVKIVWRMTGSGPLTLTVIGPQGTPGTLAWGPEYHTSSNYDRPGDEWGAGYVFKTAGCWHLHAKRTTGSADVWFKVAPK